MVKINPNFGYWKTNSSGLKVISFNLAINPSNSFTSVILPSEYEISYYITGTNTINGIEITNMNNKPFMIIPATDIAEYITQSNIYKVTDHGPIMMQTTYPESINVIGENQKFILPNLFSLSSGLYPLLCTFYIID